MGAALVFAAISSVAHAEDFLVSTSKVKVKRSPSGKSKLIFVSKDASLPLPANPPSEPSAYSIQIKRFALGALEGGAKLLRKDTPQFFGARQSPDWRRTGCRP